MNRLTTAIAKAKEQIAAQLSKGVSANGKLFNQKRLDSMAKEMDMDMLLHAQFQTLKSAVMGSIITFDEAQSLYMILGNTVNHFNKQDFATKLVTTQFCTQLAELVNKQC